MSLLFLQGAALFAFIPLVLFLYLQLPLGPGPSLGLGLVLMLGHRFIASPWMARHARERCLWCGRSGSMVGAGTLSGEVARAARSSRPLTDPLSVRAGGREWHLATCGP